MRVENIFFRRAPGLLSCLAALFLLGAFSAPARADFLDDLFGGSNDATPAPAPRVRVRIPRDNFSIKLKETRRSTARKTADGDSAQYSAGSRPQKPLLCAAQSTQNANSDTRSGESTAYLRDETLRAGDSVVTPGQIVVFKGGGGCPHASGDFVSLSRSGLPKIKRNALVSLQQGLKEPRNLDVDDEAPANPKVTGGAGH